MFVPSFVRICELVEKRKCCDTATQAGYTLWWFQKPQFLLGKEVKLKISSMTKKVWGGFNMHDSSATVTSYLKHTYTIRLEGLTYWS